VRVYLMHVLNALELTEGEGAETIESSRDISVG
jgi:hypothetical protein